MRWCGTLVFGAEDDDGGPQENSEIKVERVVEALQGGRKPDFIQIADELDEAPWECAAAWRSLVRRGVLEEGLGKQRGIFPLKAEQLESLVNRLSAAARRRLCRFVS